MQPITLPELPSTEALAAPVAEGQSLIMFLAKEPASALVAPVAAD